MYQGEAEACAACAYHYRCCRSKSGAARTVTSDGREPLRRAMNERMSSPEGRAIYRRRKAIVEPVFGQIKNTGFRGFGVRGMSRVAGEFSLVCARTTSRKWSVRRSGDRRARSSGEGRRWRRIGPAAAMEVTKRSGRAPFQSKKA